VDGEDSLQLSRVAANILKKKLREAEKIGPAACVWIRG